MDTINRTISGIETTKSKSAIRKSVTINRTISGIETILNYHVLCWPCHYQSHHLWN